MLHFISPLAIKKLILNIFMTNLSVVMNAQAQDSLAVRREERIQPRIMKVEERLVRRHQQDKWPVEAEQEWDVETEGQLVLECNNCGAKGQFRISGRDPKTKNVSSIIFATGEFRHREYLRPGEYIWEFEDIQHNQTRGMLTIKKGETRILTLFDKGSKS